MNSYRSRRHLRPTLAVLLAFSAIVVAQEPQPAKRPKVALVLSGGAARGLAHVGVITWLEEHRIPVD